jgi:branched-chain amino acid transport system permease protein
VQLVFILEQVLNGLLVGAYYLLIGLGLSDFRPWRHR